MQRDAAVCALSGAPWLFCLCPFPAPKDLDLYHKDAAAGAGPPGGPAINGPPQEKKMNSLLALDPHPMLLCIISLLPWPTLSVDSSLPPRHTEGSGTLSATRFFR